MFLSTKLVMISWTVYLVAVVVSLFLYLYLKHEKRNIPKGPRAWPVVGNGLQLKPNIQTAMANWARKYGKVYTMYFGRQMAIVINDPKLLREAFNEPALSGRPDIEMFTLMADGKHGVIASEGHEWVEQRRFTLRHLRDFGFGKNTGEELIRNELTEFMESLRKNVGQPVSMNRSFNVAVLNTLWMILSGVRYDQDDPRLWSLLTQQNELITKVGENPALFVAPGLAKLVPKLSDWRWLLEVVQKFRDIILEHVNAQKSARQSRNDGDGEPRNFIDAYLKEIDSATDSSSSFYKEAGIKSLMAVVGDLFGGGSETISLTLSWLVLHVAKFPRVQEKVRAELEQVVGRSRSPRLSDRPNLPYVEAAIAESMRMSSIVPTGAFHAAMRDFNFHGYDIPRGSLVVSNLFFIHHDERLWGNPEDFQPERFLSPDGQSFRKHDAFMPFGIGKRQCLGETLARDTIFLYFTNILHRFEISLAEESKEVTLEPVVSFILRPQDFKVILKDRQ